MSEWQDAQRKSKTTILERIAELQNAKLQPRQLSAREQRRASKLEEALADLKADNAVSNRTLQTWLLPEQFDQIAEEWHAEKTIRNESKDKPPDIKEYEEILRHAHFINNKADALSRRGKASASKMRDEATKQYERAIERLQEVISAQPELQVWFDRSLDFEAGSDIAPDYHSVPRVVTSRSLENASDGMHGAKRSKRHIKIEVVKRALQELLYEQP